MTGPPRRLSEIEPDDEEQIAAEVDAQQAGLRAYRHWRDRGEPVAPTSGVAMRQACPYARSDSRCSSFFEGWRLADGSAWDREWCALKNPEMRGRRCRIVRRDGPARVEIEFLDGSRQVVPHMWVRKVDP